MTIPEKIGILADAAKYDASCSTAGSARENVPGGIGNGAVGGICHAWSSDGRCVALLKVLLSNVCAYDCGYCVNRRSNDIPRAAFEPEELVRLVIDFYRRNYIEGVFLSSGVTGCPDRTMERLIAVAKTLRTRERFNGYIHMKAIPGSSERLVMEAARCADRVSVNIELPSAQSLARIAPDKTARAIFGPMRTLAMASGFTPKRLIASAPHAGSLPESLRSLAGARGRLPGESDPATETWPGLPLRTDRGPADSAVSEPVPLYDGRTHPESVMAARKSRIRDPLAAVLPAGQTTQLVVGASPESDATILGLAENLYLAYDVRRVYYSAFIPAGADSRIPAPVGPPLAREHRLYQADWLFRFYGFTASEILDPSRPFLDSALDPKSDWALRNLHLFPVEINTAEYRQLLRVPGIGPKSASRILRARRTALVAHSSLSRLGVIMKRARWFITCGGRMSGPRDYADSCRQTIFLDNPAMLRRQLMDPAFFRAMSLQLELPLEL